MFFDRRSTSLVPEVIEHAEGHIGFRSRANKVNEFGQRVGLNGKAWDGSFLEVSNREISVSAGVSLANTVSALAFFIQTGKLYQVPKPGDIVFYTWSAADDGLGQPHVGLVVEVRDWTRLGKFQAIEAMTSPGTAKGHVEEDGVYQRTRYRTDVLGFARPAYKKVEKIEAPKDGVPQLRPSQFVPGKTSKATVLLQTALFEAIGAEGFVRGLFDLHTRAAMARFQREIGLPEATGQPDDYSLNRLAERTSYKHFR